MEAQAAVYQLWPSSSSPAVAATTSTSIALKSMQKPACDGVKLSSSGEAELKSSATYGERLESAI